MALTDCIRCWQSMCLCGYVYGSSPEKGLSYFTNTLNTMRGRNQDTDNGTLTLIFIREPIENIFLSGAMDLCFNEIHHRQIDSQHWFDSDLRQVLRDAHLNARKERMNICFVIDISSFSDERWELEVGQIERYVDYSFLHHNGDLVKRKSR